MDEPKATDTFREWRESAPYWAKHADAVRAMFAPITAALCEAIEVRRSDMVLDVAGGAGEPSLSLAEEVGASGLVICTDAVADMVEAARAGARRRGLTNIEFARCAGDSLPFFSNRFDAVVCRLGIMLFSDPEAAAREMLRVVKPGRAVACAVWHARESNPFFHVVMDVVSRYVESAPENPDSPGAFRFAEPGKLAPLFAAAGAQEVTDRLLDFHIEAHITPRQFWEMRVELSDTLRAKVAGLSGAQLKSIEAEVEQAGRPFVFGDGMRFPARVWIIRARKRQK